MTARKLNVFTKNATGTPNAAIVSPATAGPRTLAPFTIAEFSATALTTSSRPTISMTKD
jgi:hypothetical protein